jgi:ribonuclease PH
VRPLSLATGGYDQSGDSQSVLTGFDVCAASKEKEYEQIIRQTFSPAILLENFPRAVISIVVQVVEDNGSVLSVAINAVSLALLDAGIPMLSVVTSATCAVFPDGTLVLDPSSPEEEVLPSRSSMGTVAYLTTKLWWICERYSKRSRRSPRRAPVRRTAC